MASTVKQQARKLSLWLAGLFLLLFVFRLLYGYTLSDTVLLHDPSSDFFSGLDLRKNYASEKSMGYKDGGAASPAPGFATSQKYEKTATTRARSAGFEKDQAALNGRIKSFSGVVQYEQRSGNPGDRQMHLLIGIDPEKFDSFYVSLQSIGKVLSTQVTKVDKTNEYRQLNAKKASLEKTLLSLNELKAKSGQIADYISLHEKIREMESELQDLGVDLGNFDTENEFCSVRFSLYEGAAEKKISLMHRVKVALEWTLQFYALALLCIGGILITSLVVVVLIGKVKGLIGQPK